MCAQAQLTVIKAPGCSTSPWNISSRGQKSVYIQVRKRKTGTCNDAITFLIRIKHTVTI